MKTLIVNPNSSTEMSETIDSTAKKYASQTNEITTVNIQDGPEYIWNAYYSAIQGAKVISLIERNKDKYDTFIIACGVAPGLDGSRVIAQNVIGSGEAGILTACVVANRFSFIRATRKPMPLIEAQLRDLDIAESKCASARVVGNGVDDEAVRQRHQMIDEYYQVGRACVEEDGAGALVLACAGMSDLTIYLQEKLGVPVISGVISAVKIVEQLPLS
jgi:allantoin racemase